MVTITEMQHHGSERDTGGRLSLREADIAATVCGVSQAQACDGCRYHNSSYTFRHCWHQHARHGCFHDTEDGHTSQERPILDHYPKSTGDERFSFRELAKTLLFPQEPSLGDQSKHTKDHNDHGHIHEPCQIKGSREDLLRKGKVLQPKNNIMEKSCSKIANSPSCYYILPDTTFKIVAITQIGKPLSISSLLSQIYGGPLEKVELVLRDQQRHFYNDDSLYQTEERTDWSKVSVFLYFTCNEDAMSFYRYSKSDMFKVNGDSLNTLWMPDVDEDVDEGGNKGQQIQLRRRQLQQAMGGAERARRVLVLKRPIEEKAYNRGPISHSFTRKNGHLSLVSECHTTVKHNLDIDPKEIKRDFGEYGHLIEVFPIVSRKLSFGVHYYNVASAILVKRVLENATEERFSAVDLEMRRKYGAWHVWYGRDPTERAVPSP